MKRYLFLLLAVTMLGSCVSLKKIKYIQDVAEQQKVEYLNDPNLDYKIQPGDNLYIDVKSLDTKNMNPFQNSPGVGYQMTSDVGVYLNSYIVNDSGYVDFPIVGKILVKGLSIDDVKSRLQKTVDEYFQLTTVTVKLVNFKISLLGEVVRPGTYQIYQTSINLFQAISLAGDLGSYADRSKVKIIRKTKSGSTVQTINLLETGVLESPNYYLQPDDIIYVEPLKGKNFAFQAFPYAIIFSTISTTLLIMSYFK